MKIEFGRINGRIKRAAAITGLAAALALSAVSFGGSALAQTDPGFTTGQTVYITTDSLNLRSDASATADVIATFTSGASGSVVDGPVVADSYAWYQVTIDAQTGWMVAEYLGDEAAATTTTENSAESDTAVSANAASASVVIDSGTLNIRSEASVDAEVVASLENGDAVTVLSGPLSANGYDWYEIDADGVTGWAVSIYLSNGLASLDLLLVGGSATVSTDYLNLRTDASGSSDVIATLATGEGGTILDGPVVADGLTWFQVETDYGTGWLAGEYLTV